MNRSIDCRTGIWDTDYRLITKHNNGEVTLRIPYVHWRRGGQEGVLRHYKKRFPARESVEIIKFFEAGKLHLGANNGCGILSLQDIIDGHLSAGVVCSDD